MKKHPGNTKQDTTASYGGGKTNKKKELELTGTDKNQRSQNITKCKRRNGFSYNFPYLQKGIKSKGVIA